MFNIEEIWISFDCPKCKYAIDIQLIDAKNEIIVFCHNCKTSIQLKDDNASSHKGVRAINNAFEELNKSLKNLGK